MRRASTDSTVDRDHNLEMTEVWFRRVFCLFFVLIVSIVGEGANTSSECNLLIIDF